MGDRETVQTEADEGITTVRTNVGDQAEQKENKDKDAEKDVEKDKEGRKRKAMEPRSDVWDGYHKILVGGLLKKAKCKYCGRELRCQSKRNGTSSLKYPQLAKMMKPLLDEWIVTW